MLTRFLLVLLFAAMMPHSAQAEVYGIFLRVRMDAEHHAVVVSIASDSERLDRTSVSIEEAAKLLKHVQGPSALVYIVAGELPPGAIKPLLDAIGANDTLWLASFHGAGSMSRDEIEARLKKKGI